MSGPRTPFERMLPAWLAVSVLVHAAAFSAAALLPRADSGPPAGTMRWVVVGTVAPSAPPEPAPGQGVTPPPAIEAPRMSPAPTATAPSAAPERRSSASRRAAAHAEASRGAEPSRGASDAEAASGDRLASLPPGSSASAPAMGRPGAAVDGPLAGGGARELTAMGGGPVSFAVTAPAAGGGSGPGLGGSGSGLGAGGSGTGIGGAGTPGGAGIGAGGEGGSGTGRIASRGSVGSGPGAGAGAGSPLPAAPGPLRQPAARPARKRAPQPPPAATESEAQPDPVAGPEPPPQPSQADLSRFRSMVQSRIQSARRYPSSARQQGQEGTVRVSFSVGPSGNPSGLSVVASSGYQALDNEALRAVSRAAPFRPFPAGLNRPIRVTATVTFRLN
ncbi:MAG: energy transducer TonB [Armatimonadota bacterium]